MARYAFYNTISGYISALFELVEPQDFVSPFSPDWDFIIATSSSAQLGGYWNGSSFDPPGFVNDPDPLQIFPLLFAIGSHNDRKVTVIGSVPPSKVAALGTVGSSALAARADHVHQIADIAPNSSPGRSLNTAFQPNADKQTLCIYAVQITCTANVAGGQNGKVELMSDSANPPTTVRATAQNRNSVSLAIALTAVNEQTVLLVALVPAGHYVRLLTTQTLGTPAFSLVGQTEIPLG